MNGFLLIKPDEDHRQEIHDYRREFLDEGSPFHGDTGLQHFEDVSEWIDYCRRHEHEETVPEGRAVGEQYMLVREGDSRILGMISLRPYLNDYLAEHAGHIGYGVRPSERRKGYATLMLSMGLDRCREHGLESVLLVCLPENQPSRRTIVACGGVFERMTIGGEEVMERYWISLGDAEPVRA